MGRWPSEIEITLTSRSTSRPLADILVLVQLVASKKNNYSLPPMLTDCSGKVRLGRTELEALTSAMQSGYPMDYGVSLSGCTGLLINVEDPKLLVERIERLREFYPAEAAKLTGLARSAQNARVVPLETLVAVNPLVEIALSERPREFTPGS